MDDPIETEMILIFCMLQFDLEHLEPGAQELDACRRFRHLFVIVEAVLGGFLLEAEPVFELRLCSKSGMWMTRLKSEIRVLVVSFELAVFGLGIMGPSLSLAFS